jgi:hypothetical protein
MRLKSILSVSIGLLALSAAPLVARPKTLTAPVETDYAFALSAANHFLHAWQTNDQETGMLMLTDRLKQTTDEDAVSEFFSSSTKRPQSFEIGRGRKLAAGRYKFPVTLFQNSSTRKTRPQTSTLIVVYAGKDDWAIDRLP